MNKDITIVIPSYKSKRLIFKHVKNISKRIQIIIVENSRDKHLKDVLNKKYKNVKVTLEKNIGYGNAINKAANLVKTKYFFVINPDTKIYSSTLNLLVRNCKKIKKFGAISPNHILYKKKKYERIIVEKEVLTGGAMLFETKIFKKMKGFDKNIFLFYEDNDYFTKCKNNGYKLYIIMNSFHDHKKKSKGSAFFQNENERNYAYYLTGWHGQWSKFYYHKKYFGYVIALQRCLPNLFTNLLQLLLNVFINQKKAKYIYFKIEGLLASIMGFSSYKRSKYD